MDLQAIRHTQPVSLYHCIGLVDENKICTERANQQLNLAVSEVHGDSSSAQRSGFHFALIPARVSSTQRTSLSCDQSRSQR